MPYQSLAQVLDEERAEIVADYRATCERARRYARERLQLHAVKRRQVLSAIAALGTGAPRIAEKEDA